MLTQIGYFSLIGGYKSPFKNPTTQKYKNGTRFEDIVALYHAVYSIDIRYEFSTDKDAYLLKKILVCTWLLAMGQNRLSERSPKKRGKRQKAGRGDDVHHLFDGCRRDRGDNRNEMKNRKRTSPIQEPAFYRQFNEKSNPMSNDWHLKLNSYLANRKKYGM